MIIVGVDPGKITGLAIFVRALDGTDKIHAEEVPAREVGTLLRQWTAGIHDKSMIWAVEKFVIMPGRPQTSQPDALLVTGTVQGLAVGSRYVEQGPGPAKRICNDQMLKRLGWYTPTKDGHANDAKRHIVLAMATYYVPEFAAMVGV